MLYSRNIEYPTREMNGMRILVYGLNIDNSNNKNQIYPWNEVNPANYTYQPLTEYLRIFYVFCVSIHYKCNGVRLISHQKLNI